MSSPSSKEENITLEFLSPDQYGEIESIYEENGDNQIPHPVLSQIAIARNEQGNIVGMLADALTPMVTMWIREDYRNGGIWKQLVEMIYPLTQGRRTYVIATRLETQEMCERLGLRKIEFPVYVKDS